MVMANVWYAYLAIMDGEYWVFYNPHLAVDSTPVRLYGPKATVERFESMLREIHHG